MKSIIIYTVNLGNYDPLNEVPEYLLNDELLNERVRYLYYTDKNKAPKGWERMYYNPMAIDDEIFNNYLHNEFEFNSLRQASRLPKIDITVLPDHDISIYIDASYKITDDLIKMLKYHDLGFSACPHYHTEVYSHLDMLIELRKESEKEKNRIIRYFNEYPDIRKIKLTENSILIRDNTPDNILLGQKWWEIYNSLSDRDQLSLPVALLETKSVVNLLPFSARDNDYLFGWGEHL